jgi:hypothetical protein
MREDVPPFTEEEIKALEDQVLTGSRPGKMLQPIGPRSIIKEISSGAPNEPLVKILCRLYVEYERLCGFTHSDLSSQTAHAFLSNSDAHPCSDHLMRTVTREPLWMSYIAMLIGITEASLHVKDPVALRVALCGLWEPFEKGHLLGKFVWLNWARRAIGVLDSGS